MGLGVFAPSRQTAAAAAAATSIKTVSGAVNAAAAAAAAKTYGPKKISPPNPNKVMLGPLKAYQYLARDPVKMSSNSSSFPECILPRNKK